MQAILSKVKLGSQTGGRPPAAVEISTEGALAAALAASGEVTYALTPLAPDALAPGVAEANLRAAEAVENAVRSALNQVSPRTRAVTLVVPDSAVRVFVLDFDSFPTKADEAYAVLRFRLRKMVPFDVEHAGLSYQVLGGSKTECRVLAAVLPGTILAEYEAAVQKAGYEAGSVLPSTLAALAALDTTDPVLAANLSRHGLTTAISYGDDLLLYRTLELPDDQSLQLDEVRRGIAVAAAYFEDKLGMRPTRLHYTGIGTARQFADWVSDPSLTIIELRERPVTGGATALGSLSIAGLAGALAGAR